MGIVNELRTIVVGVVIALMAAVLAPYVVESASNLKNKQDTLIFQYLPGSHNVREDGMATNFLLVHILNPYDRPIINENIVLPVTNTDSISQLKLTNGSLAEVTVNDEGSININLKNLQGFGGVTFSLIGVDGRMPLPASDPISMSGKYIFRGFEVDFLEDRFGVPWYYYIVVSAFSIILFVLGIAAYRRVTSSAAGSATSATT